MYNSIKQADANTEADTPNSRPGLKAGQTTLLVTRRLVLYKVRGKVQPIIVPADT